MCMDVTYRSVNVNFSTVNVPLSPIFRVDNIAESVFFVRPAVRKRGYYGLVR